MVGQMDKYVSRTVIGSYAASLLFMLLLTTLIDLLLNLGDYLRAADALDKNVFTLFMDLGFHYLVLSPFLFVTIAPFVTVIAGMFAVSRLMSANELAPMIFTGRSMLRILRPVMYSALFSAVGMAVCWEFVVPALADKLEASQHAVSGESTEASLRRPIVKHRDAEYRYTLFSKAYNHSQQQIEAPLLLVEGRLAADSQLIKAESAIWNPAENDWELVAGKRSSGNLSSPQDMLGFPGLTPEGLWRTRKEAQQTVELSYSDLTNLIEMRPGRKQYVLGLHTHITFPLANFILLLLALPFAVHFERGSKIERVLFAILICGLYLVTDLTCQNLMSSGLHPVLAAWLPTILFGSMGVVFFGSMRT